MMTIAARVPKIDWNQGFDRHWNGGNPAVTHAFNALSFLFPKAERFFIDVAREVVVGVDLESNPALAERVKGFIAQESTHSHHHNQYNAVLRTQGYENVVESLDVRLQGYLQRHFSSLTKLAVVCASWPLAHAFGS